MLVVALCGCDHITTSTQEGESPHRWLLAGGHWQEALRALPKAWEGFVGVFSKCCYLQEENVSIGGLSQDDKPRK